MRATGAGCRITCAQYLSACSSLRSSASSSRCAPTRRRGRVARHRGTLAPIVRHPSDAKCPEPTRERLIALSKRYGVVACVSGRSAAVARQMVAIGSIAYIGNHGCELLRPGATEAIVDPRVARWTGRDRGVRRRRRHRELQQLRVRREDKGPIVGFHWRGAPDEDGAARGRRGDRARGARAGLEAHHGRKVLEIRPPVPIDKGRGVRWLLADDPPAHGVYVGDDITDVDAFAGLRDGARRRRACASACAPTRRPRSSRRRPTRWSTGRRGVRGLLGELLR